MNVNMDKKEWYDKEFKKEQRDSVDSRRNTVTVPFVNQRKRSRAWFMTLNNYEEKDIEHLSSDNRIMKYLFQEEIGKSGNKHLQGIFYFKNDKGLMWMKKEMNNLAHWEICKNWNAGLNYCSKIESCNGRKWRKGCKENRVKEESKYSDDDIIELRMKQLVEETCKEIKGWCFEVGHPLKNCWCKQTTPTRLASLDPPSG